MTDYDWAYKPDLDMSLHMLLQQRGWRQLFAAGPAGVHLGSGKFFAMFLQVQGQLALQDKLIPALWTQKVLKVAAEKMEKEKVGKKKKKLGDKSSSQFSTIIYKTQQKYWHTFSHRYVYCFWLCSVHTHNLILGYSTNICWKKAFMTKRDNSIL